ncbi:MAG: rod shape-determining protein MreD [Clostridiales bacterium]|nr:rod shape-determining protein MreD [Clostridiales bacterium]
MRKWLFALSLLTAFFLDNVFLNTANVLGLRPDVTLAMLISLGVLLGPAPAALTGFITGLLADIFFNKIVGLTALTYMLSGLAGGLFYRKFYADNLIIPTVTAMVCSFLKEHFFLIASLLYGSKPNYFAALGYYILPCFLLTGGVCLLIHLFFKAALFKPLYRKEAIKLD